MMQSVHKEYFKITKYLIEHKLSITTMESCTSGMIASLITDTEGASAVFQGAFVTYCNRMKVENGVSEEVIKEYGVYSVETAKAMASACREKMKATIGIGVTGSLVTIDPENHDSVPGEVYICIIWGENQVSEKFQLSEGLSRLEAKLEVAKLVAEKFWELALIENI